MAGRGRGRGRGNLSFDISSLGFGRGETLPGAILQPPPLFPPLDYKPLPLTASDDDLYVLAIKQEFRAAMKDSPYYLGAKENATPNKAANSSTDWTPDWRNIPKELHPGIKSSKRKLKAQISGDAKEEKLTEALKTEINDTNQEPTEEKEDNDDEENDAEEAYDEDEEENDYNVNYFDDGGDDYGGDDDPDEGPVY